MLEEYDVLNKGLNEWFTFREIRLKEADQAVLIEQICFPAHEACAEPVMRQRVAEIPELFYVAVDKDSKQIAGFLNGIATNEYFFRDEFFTDTSLHDPAGSNVMLLGLDVLPQYRRKGLATEIVSRYLQREKERDRKSVVLTCLESKVQMYEKMGFYNNGIAQSSWGNEQWYEMRYTL